jgi:predicted Zn-dependent protease
MKAILALCSVLLLAGCASTGPTASTRYWNLETCVGLPNPNIRVGRADQSVVVIPRANCERVKSAAVKIQEKADLRLAYIYIADLDMINAFATRDKNGNPVVILTLGMLLSLGADEDAWAGLMGHEIAHLVRNHAAGRQDAQTGAQLTGNVLANVVSALVPGVGGAVAGTITGTVAQNAMYGAYTRPQEAEADELGLKWMVAAGYDPRGLRGLFEIFGRQSSVPAFLSTHPGAEDRFKMVQDYINKSASLDRKPKIEAVAVASPTPAIGQQTATATIGTTQFQQPNTVEKYQSGKGLVTEENRKPSVDLALTSRKPIQETNISVSATEAQFAAAREANDLKQKNNAIAVAKGAKRWVWGTSWSAGTEGRAKELALDHCRKQAAMEGIQEPCAVYSVNGGMIIE